MRGKLSEKLFPSVLRELAAANATGRLRLTQNGKIREILIESGVPVFASSTIPEEQPEYWLVQEDLITPEQLNAAMATARRASQPVEKILVQTKTITRLGLQRILCELSTAIINSASEWVAGEYAFAQAPKVPLEAKLIWSSTECILTGARHASCNTSVLDDLAPDDRTVKPSLDRAAAVANSASLSSTEGYVLSCIQSPTTVAEASMLTGLSHIETRRAILVLMMLGLLEGEGTPKAAPAPANELKRDDPPRSQIAHEPRREAPPPAQATPIQARATQTSQTPEIDSGILSAQRQVNGGNAARAREHDDWPLEFESGGYTGFDDDSSQTQFNSGDTSFIDFPEQSRPPQRPENGTGAAPRVEPAVEQISSANSPTVGMRSAHGGGPAHSSNSETTRTRENSGSIFIPPQSLPPLQTPANGTTRSAVRPSAPVRESVQENSASTFGSNSPVSSSRQGGGSGTIARDHRSAESNTGSIFIPSATPSRGAPGPSRETPSPSTEVPPREPSQRPAATPPPVAPFRANTGSIYIPGVTPRSQSRQGPVPFRGTPVQPASDYPGSGNQFGAPQQQTLPPPVSPANLSDSDFGHGYNGETDPRLHQEWRDQVASDARQDSAEDERFLKRIIDELGAKIRMAASADYYQILGVDKLASNGNITKAYERISRINDSHKSRWPYNEELQAQISSLMVVVTKAYETLGNPEKRRIYDIPPKQQAPAMEIERGTGPVTGSIASRPAPAAPQRPAASPQAGAGGLAGAGAGAAPDPRNPYQAAEELYRRGCSAFARSDLQAAAHLLRQAVNLDPGRSTYHYQLGMTLFILSQARAEHKHDKGCHVTCKMGGNLTRNQRIRHEAEQNLLKASELEPSNADIKLKLALLYKDAHMDRKAHQYFYEALMLDPNCHIARVELGMENSSKKERDEDQWIKDLMKDRMKKK